MTREQRIVDHALNSRRLLIRRDAGSASPKFSKVLDYLAERMFLRSFCIEALIQEFRVSRFWLADHFGRELKSRPKDYISGHKVVAAELILKNSNLKIWQVAEAVGFNSPRSFTRAFKQQFGASPSEARSSGQEPERLVSEQALDRERLEHTASWVLWPYLRALPPEERLRVVGEGFQPARLQVVQGLIQKSKEKGRSDRRRGVQIARLAVDVLANSSFNHETGDESDLLVEALANLGNRQRLATDWDGAERSFEKADYWRRKRFVGRTAEAVFMGYWGIFRVVRRQFEKAGGALRRACELYESLGDCVGWIRTRLAQGYSLELQGKPLEAAAIYQEVEGPLGEIEEDGLYLEATVSSRLACAFGLAGNLQASEAHLRKAKDAAQECGLDSEVFGLVWIEALLTWRRGLLDESKRLLQKAQAGLNDAGEVGNAALVGVDLALLYLQLGDSTQAMEAASEAVPVLESLILEGEALLALGFLAKATSKGVVDEQVLAMVRRSLELRLGSPSLELLPPYSPSEM